MRFRTTVELGGKTATGSPCRPRSWRGWTPGSGPPSGSAAGDAVEVDVELDSEPRDVPVPADMAAALAGDDAAARGFDALPYSHRLRHVLAVEGAKAAETRRRRIDKALEMLREGSVRRSGPRAPTARLRGAVRPPHSA